MMITTGLILECQSSSFNLDAHSALHHPHEKKNIIMAKTKKKALRQLQLRKHCLPSHPQDFLGCPGGRAPSLKNWKPLPRAAQTQDQLAQDDRLPQSRAVDPHGGAG
jgi:hypothetical protein